MLNKKGLIPKDFKEDIRGISMERARIHKEIKEAMKGILLDFKVVHVIWGIEIDLFNHNT